MSTAEDVKDMAKHAGQQVKRAVQSDAPIDRLRDLAEQADSNVRSFAKEQPVMALMVALSLGYLVGRVVSRSA